MPRRLRSSFERQILSISSDTFHASDSHEIEFLSEWTHILATGQRKTTVEMISDALVAQVNQSKPALGNAGRDELHRLAALWVAKHGRPQAIVEDKHLETLLARILELCKCQLRYSLPTQETVRDHLTLLGDEGKTLGRNFMLRLLKSGVKPSWYLWSDNGMGLFGIYAHGITETWVMEKALIGLVACETKVSSSAQPTTSPTFTVFLLCFAATHCREHHQVDRCGTDGHGLDH